jgi:Ca2+-binding RTX toxin-like protein
MTFKTTQYAWFNWFDPADGTRLVDIGAVAFEAVSDGSETSTHVRLNGDGYYLDVYGTGLEVDENGVLSAGIGTRMVMYDASTDVKMVQWEDDGINIANFLAAYEGGGLHGSNPVGSIFDASAVPAQPGGVGIGTYGANDGNDTMFGSGGADELIAFKGDDIVRGNGGNDRLLGYEGNDTVYGGTGNDQLLGYTGNDKLYGDSGSDLVSGEDGKDTLDGGSGNDDVYGGAGNDDVKGGTGHDFLVGGTGKDTLNGGSGHDWATASLDSTKSDSFTIDLAKKTIKSAYGTDKLSSIENAYGSAGKDLIKGELR